MTCFRFGIWNDQKWARKSDRNGLRSTCMGIEYNSPEKRSVKRMNYSQLLVCRLQTQYIFGCVGFIASWFFFTRRNGAHLNHRNSQAWLQQQKYGQTQLKSAWSFPVLSPFKRVLSAKYRADPNKTPRKHFVFSLSRPSKINIEFHVHTRTTEIFTIIVDFSACVKIPSNEIIIIIKAWKMCAQRKLHAETTSKCQTLSIYDGNVSLE